MTFLDNLFSDDVPCRVIVCFIQNDRKLGNYQNPYDFRRHWDVASGFETVHRNREQFLEAKLNQLEKTLQLVLEQQTKGKGRGKKSSNPQPSTSQSFLNRIRSFRSNPNQELDQRSLSSHQSHEEEDNPPSYSEIGNDDDISTDTKRIFVKKVELLLNGTPLGNLESLIMAL